jgi:thiol-disulfide isomerase/thioredoxin
VSILDCKDGLKMRKLICQAVILTLASVAMACSTTYAASNQAAFQSPLSKTRAIPRHVSGEPMPFFASDNAQYDLQTALTAAKEAGKKPLIIMGANWCHDSRALAAHFETPRFVRLLENNYQPVYIDVGQKDRNIDIAQRYGYNAIEGTPTVIILSSNGDILNQSTAPTWRDAASRSRNDIYDYFKRFAQDDAPIED